MPSSRFIRYGAPKTLNDILLIDRIVHMHNCYTYSQLTKYLISDMDEEYDFDDNDFDDRDKFNEDILKMLKRGSPNDVKIKLNDGEMFANKDILMARSEYFSTMFSNNKFIEGETSSVDMTHCSKAVMAEIIEFLFSGVAMFRDLSLVQLVELSHISKMMLMSKFQKQV